MKKIVALLTVLLCGCVLASAQTRKIAGKVVDTSGRPIEGDCCALKLLTTIRMVQKNTAFAD